MKCFEHYLQNKTHATHKLNHWFYMWSSGVFILSHCYTMLKLYLIIIISSLWLKYKNIQVLLSSSGLLCATSEACEIIGVAETNPS